MVEPLNYGIFNQKGTELTITVGSGIHNLYLWDIGYFSRIIAYNAQKWTIKNKKNVPCFESENRPIKGIMVIFWAIRR
jgi:hypothetical protein